MRACVRLTREIFGQHAFDALSRTGNPAGEDVQTDEQIDAFIRAKVESAYHRRALARWAALKTRWR